MSFIRPKNLKNYLVRARLSKDQKSSNRGTARCDNRRCHICRNHIVMGHRFLNHRTKKILQHYGLDCNSIKVLYLLSCWVCGLQYVGYITLFRLCFNNHKNGDDLIYKQFCLKGHRGMSDIEVMLIERVFEEQLKDRGPVGLYRLRTVAPDERNSNHFFYSQNRRKRARKQLSTFVLSVVIFIVTNCV